MSLLSCCGMRAVAAETGYIAKCWPSISRRKSSIPFRLALSQSSNLNQDRKLALHLLKVSHIRTKNFMFPLTRPYSTDSNSPQPRPTPSQRYYDSDEEPFIRLSIPRAMERLEAKIDAIHAKMESDKKEIYTKMDSDKKEIYTKMDSDKKELHAKMDSDKKEVNEKFEKLMTKLETVEREQNKAFYKTLMALAAVVALIAFAKDSQFFPMDRRSLQLNPQKV